MNSLPLYVVDAFTDRPFAGNPAGVCLLDRTCPDGWMQSLAAEMKHSETAYLLPETGGYRLRWFTPVKEVDLCGHATLASAHVLFETGRLRPEEAASFFTRSGLLTACQRDGWTELNFPARSYAPDVAPVGLLQALGIQKARFVGRNQLRYLIEVEADAAVRSLAPDFAALRALDLRAVIVTARSSDPQYDFISRYFAPKIGIDEDPVTGSAHCALGPYWSERLGKTSFTAYQASPRGGTLRVRVEGDRVVLGGQAVTIFSAQIGF